MYSYNDTGNIFYFLDNYYVVFRISHSYLSKETKTHNTTVQYFPLIYYKV
jgi:hypothetical protein